MSRTWKDRPYWVQINNPKNGERVVEDHFHHANFWNGYEWDGICTIDEPAVPWRERVFNLCTKDLDWSYSRRWSDLPSRESVHNLWYAPLRMEERTELETCKKIYNASGLSELEDRDIIITEKHGGGPYGGGYWD